MRINNSIKNTVYSVGAQLIGLAITFITRTVFIKNLGAEYLGVSGVFSNILSMLSLAELGVGSAITFALYRPLAEKNTDKIAALMNFYGKAYKCIGVLISILGIILFPFLDILIKDKSNIPNISVIYLLFLINSAISYFYSYKSAIIIADQKGYINTINQYTFIILQNIMQIIILFKYKNYILFLIIQIICTVLTNISISKKAELMYPYLKDNKYGLDKMDKRNIYKNTLAMVCHKIGGIVVTGTDNLLLSSFIGVSIVGVYSNYTLIVNTVNGIIAQIFTSITSSLGNLNSEGNLEKSYDIYKKIMFITFWIIGLSSIILFSIINTCITMWIGEEYLLDRCVVTLIIINFFINGMRQVPIMYINTMGLFWKIKYKSIIEAIINLIVSIILLKYIGISGVILGTLVSTILTNLWWEPYVTFKYGLRRNCIDHFKIYIRYWIVFVLTLILTLSLGSFIFNNIISKLIYKILLALIIPNLTWIIIFRKSEEFKYFKSLIIKIILKK